MPARTQLSTYMHEDTSSRSATVPAAPQGQPDRRADRQLRGWRIQPLTAWVIGVLCAGGAIAIALRLALLDATALPSGDSAWTVHYTIAVDAARQGQEIRVHPPWDTRFVRLIRQDLEHPDLRLRRVRAAGAGREIVLVTSRPGRFSASATFDLHLSELPRRLRTRIEPFDPEQRERWLTAEAGIELEAAQVAALLQRYPGNLAPPQLLRAMTLDLQRDLRSAAGGADDAASTLRTGLASNLGRARTLVAMSRALGIPARLVGGFVLGEASPARPRYWAEALIDDAWRPYDPEHGHAGEMPRAYTPVVRGGRAMVEAIPEVRVDVGYRITRGALPAAVRALSADAPLDVLDLNRLPPGLRSTLAILLLMPFGALVTGLARSVGGVRTYGTFTPTLLAMTLLYIDWLTAAIVLGVVGVFGIAGRSLLPDLGLSRVPRLGIVFTVVAMSMALAVSLLAFHDQDAGGLVVLLPIVILTMLVDRVYTVADESGLRVALIRLWWTVVVAGLCFALFVQAGLGQLVLSYPEIHAFTMAAMILQVAYRGPRLSDYPPLRWLVEPPAPRRRRAAARRAHDTCPRDC